MEYLRDAGVQGTEDLGPGNVVGRIAQRTLRRERVAVGHADA
jgi:hypothetical protein